MVDYVPNPSVSNHTLTLSATMVYYDTFGALVIRDCSLGGGGTHVIIQADTVLRTQMFRVNDIVLPQP